MSDMSANEDKRRRLLTGLGAVVAVAAVAYGLYWFLDARHYVSTDDAYVGGDIVAVTSQENGKVIKLRADNTQTVKRGDVLVELDPLRARVAMDAAEAELARTVRGVRAKFSRVEELRAQETSARIALTQARNDLARRQKASDTISQEELAHARDAVTRAEAAINVIQGGIAQALASVEGTRIADNPDVLAAIAHVRDASITLGHMQITAAVDGVIAQRGVQIGQMISTGTPLMAVVPVDGLWIDANFKEGQLGEMRIGQPVTVEADLYGDDVTYHGKVIGFSAGTGSAFALLPPQNASGNWIKIVQRVPVRIALDPKELREHPLRIGLSVHAEVDLRDRSGAVMGTSTHAREVATEVGAIEAATDQVIARILSENGA
ncbi:MAG: HlyD family efflux transporter periplasmic adaptor subunit [Rhodospirillaceae bacterium]|nr:HlyD family efflux transporter periplasmic adaptor subunit [Rhodospirillaceae bacterium]